MTKVDMKKENQPCRKAETKKICFSGIGVPEAQLLLMKSLGSYAKFFTLTKLILDGFLSLYSPDSNAMNSNVIL